jgi:hypothetical protein
LLATEFSDVKGWWRSLELQLMSGGYGAAAPAAAPLPVASVGEKEQFRFDWTKRFAKATQHDSWGQIVEAQEEYHVLAAVIAAKQGLPMINSKKDTMFKLVQCLSARSQSLKTMDETITSVDMKALQPVFEALFTGSEPAVFPLDPRKYLHAQAVKPSTEGEIICGDADEPYSDWQQSQAVLKSITGTAVALRIEKIGLKDAQEYIDPFMSVIIGDPRGNIVQSYDIPAPKTRSATYCNFGHQVYLTVSLEDLTRQNAALFFEFKHYKPKKKKVSTRCWSFMELSELKVDEEMILEIYHKPTDLKKKKVKLHSEKHLYLHLFATFISAG